MTFFLLGNCPKENGNCSEKWHLQNSLRYYGIFEANANHFLNICTQCFAASFFNFSNKIRTGRKTVARRGRGGRLLSIWRWNNLKYRRRLSPTDENSIWNPFRIIRSNNTSHWPSENCLFYFVKLVVTNFILVQRM